MNSSIQSPQHSITIQIPENKQKQQKINNNLSILDTTNQETNINSQQVLNQDSIISQNYNTAQAQYEQTQNTSRQQQQQYSLQQKYQNNNQQQHFMITEVEQQQKLMSLSQNQTSKFRYKDQSQLKQAIHSMSVSNLQQIPDEEGPQVLITSHQNSSSHLQLPNSHRSHTKFTELPLLNKIRLASNIAKQKYEIRKQEDKEKLNDIQLEKEDLKKMEGTFYNKPFDKQHHDLHGEGVSKQFFKNFKNLNRIIQENQYHKIQNSPYTEMNLKAHKQRILPSKMGLIVDEDHTQRLNSQKVNIGSMRYGNSYISVLGSACKSVQSVNSFTLNNNRIGEYGSKKLLPQIVLKAKKLKLQSNKIGKIGVSNLSKALANKQCQIEYLNLEDNQLGDFNIINILQSLEINSSFRNPLKILHLSKNYLTDLIKKPLQALIEENKSTLKELYLHWNNLTSETGKVIFECLAKSTQMEVLDLSHNSLGTCVIPDNTCVPALQQFLETNTYLIHLDLSSNNFDYEDTKDIAKSLELNKSIYGFHFAGNSGWVDSRQFLIPEKNIDDISSLIKKQRINSCKVVKDKLLRSERDQVLKDVCWICEGWKQQEFIYRSKTGGTQVMDPAFIHFSFEDYTACYFGQQKNMDELVYKRMVPPGDLRYFFSFMDEDQQPTVFINKSEKTIKNPEHDGLVEDIPFLDRIIQAKLPNYNYKIIEKDYEIVKNGDVKPDIPPRTRDQQYIPAKMKKKKVKWTFPKSLMAKWQADNEELISLCFEYDWECGKIQKICKDPQQIEDIKNFFRENYQFVKDTYKFYASFNPIQDIWAIQTLSFNDFINKINIIDSKITPADVNIKWTATLSTAKGLNIVSAAQLMSTKPKESFTFLSENISKNQSQATFEEHMQSKDSIEELTPLNQIGQKSPQSSSKYGNTLTIGLQTPSHRMSRLGPGRPSINFIPEDLAVQTKEGTIMKSLSNLKADTQLGAKNPRNPPNGLNRFQFMDLIVRIAEEKYINKLQTTKNYFEAVKQLWDEHLKDEMACHNTQNWRNLRYWNEGCDTVLKHYKSIIEFVYSNFSKKKVKPGQTPFMCLDELQQLCSQMGLDILEHWSSSEHQFAFNLSMQTQVDELCVDRIFQMNIVEFYEAIARLAEKACFLPLEGAPGVEDIEDEATWPLAKRKELSLAFKMEGFVIQMYQNCTTPAFKKSQPQYNKSVFWVDPDESDFDLVD